MTPIELDTGLPPPWTIEQYGEDHFTLRYAGRQVATARLARFGLLPKSAVPLVSWASLGDMTPQDALDFAEALTALTRKLQEIAR